MRLAWIETSRAEKQLAHDVASSLSQLSYSEAELCHAVEALALELVGKADSAQLLDPTEKVLSLLAEIPLLREIDLSSPFPTKQTDLTGNFFNSLAYELGTRFRDPADLGVVGTPPVLAVDMVNIAASYWLADQTGESVKVLFPLVSGQEYLSASRRELLSSLLKRATWYDPCLGGGIFPLAILLLSARFGIAPDVYLFSNIEGVDLDPLAVTASRIRTALLVSQLTDSPYYETWDNTRVVFSVDNSLERLPEQGVLGLETTDPTTMVTKDIVVGNPPYVRGNRIPKHWKDYLKKAFPSVAGGFVDLYSYFIVHGLLALKPRGTLTYISPASFQKSKYGKATRKYIEQNGHIRAVFDFDELPVFSGASIHTSIYVISRGQNAEEVTTYTYRELPEKDPLFFGFKRSVSLEAGNFGEEGWYIGSPDTRAILEILCRDAVPLGDYVGHIYSGIKTGYSAAYVLSEQQALSLQADESSRPFIKPLLQPINIRAWRAEWDGTHIILPKKGQAVPEGSAVMQHLYSFKAQLEKRSDVQGHETWYGLRECNYYEVFDNPKIVFPDIASENRFALDTAGFIIPDGAFMLPVEDYFLLGILNSCVGSFYFRARCNTIGNPANRGRLRFKKTYVRDFPLPAPTDELAAPREELSALARLAASGKGDTKIMQRIDELAILIYRVPEDYKAALLRK